jgi:hypothetical protein
MVVLRPAGTQAAAVDSVTPGDHTWARVNMTSCHAQDQEIRYRFTVDKDVQVLQWGRSTIQNM